MSESVSLPALGESVTEGTVTRWLKQVGDRVEVDEPLLEVSTDKVDTEIPSPVAGVLEEILVAEDETVEVGTALVRIGDGSGGGAAEVAPAAEAPAPEGAQAEPAPVQEAPAAEPQAAPAEAAAQPQAAQPQSAPAEPAPAEPAPAAAAPTQAAPADAAPAETAPAQASPVEQPAPADAPAPALAAEPAATPEPESTEVPSSGAPAPGQEAPQAAPAPAEEVDQPPAAQGQQAEPAAAPQSAAPQQAAVQPQPAAEPQAADQGAEGDTSNAGYVTPLVRKLANEKGVDLSGIRGTGVGGRIRKQDVLDAAPAAASEAPATEAAPAPTSTKLEDSPLRGTTVPMSRLRKVVSERAVASMQGTAQLTTVVEVDVTKVATLRDKVKGDFQQKTGQKLSFLPFFAKAAVEALRAYPIINATVDGTDIVYPDHEHLSIAVDTERGLLTPVVRDASTLDIAQLAGQIADLAARTRDNKLKPDELAGGTFTLTNTGSRGALFDTPLVFLPQSAILGTGIVTKKPVVVKADGGDAIAIRSTVYLALSYDHRIVDGADAARFLVAVKNRLEEGEFMADLGI
jgi:2-oxoglutarate dehydrogenase E2 component (dihydrolipoamide succinyltransferase)